MPIRKVSAILLRVPRPIGPRAGSRKAWEKAKAEGRRVPLARCDFVIPRRGTPKVIGFASSWQDLRPLHPTRRASPSGLPTGCFDSGFDQESLRALLGPSDQGRLPLSPWTLIDHGPCPLDPRRRRSAPAPLTNPARIGCAPLQGASQCGGRP